jgi:poly(3-hydroxybutyrate) depolymerase
MLYQIHEWQRSFLGPLSYFAQANARMLNDSSSPLAQMPGAQRMAAGYELIHRLGKEYEKPEFGIHSATAHGQEIAVIERVGWTSLFASSSASSASVTIRTPSRR